MGPVSPILLLAALFLPIGETLPLERKSGLGSVRPANRTIDTPHLKTWWHQTGEVNDWTVVKDGNVRQSHAYSVKVASTDSASAYYDSFVYESLPRNGHGNILDPRDQRSFTNDEDGISIERDIGMSMAWSSFLYGADVFVRVARLDGAGVKLRDVTLRPNDVSYNVSDKDGAVYIHVPYQANGFKFSVEFADDMFDFHNSCDGTHCAILQDVNPDGLNYVEEFAADNPVVATEPLNSLLIFASPFPSSDMVPNRGSEAVHVVQPGFVSGLDAIEKSTIFFPPGVFWFGSIAHANLSSTVDWVHFSEGSYVKGAIQYNTNASVIKATGHGVLSGEQYVYQANPSLGYINSKSNAESLRMWRGNSIMNVNQTFVIHGPTVNAPPFNSMDFTGHVESMAVDARDYKQVGAFFAQTDGLQAYPGSHMRDIFYHSNDDTIKTYYSDVLIERITVWKAHTAPIIQFGWASRNLTNVTVDRVDVIHSRWNTNGSHPSIIGGNQVYEEPEDVYNTAETANTIKDITYSNIRAEGISGNLFRIMPLANIENFAIRNVSLHSFPAFSTGISGSQLVSMTDVDGNPVAIKDFVVEGFSVNGSDISFAQGNWDTSGLGNMNIASDLRSSVSIVDGISRKT